MNKGLFSNPAPGGETNLGGARAWVKFSASTTGVKILSSYNVRGVTRGSKGVYTIFFQRPFLSPDYVVTICVQNDGVGVAPFIGFVGQGDLGLNDRKAIGTTQGAGEQFMTRPRCI